MSSTAAQFRDAVRSLRANGQRTALMMSGVAVAVAVLALVVMIGEGTRDRILDTVQKHGLDMIMVRAGGDVQVFAPTADRGLASLLPEDAEAIRTSIPNVVLVSPVQNQRNINVVVEDRSVVTRAFGVGPDWMEIRRWGMAEGAFLDSDDESAMARVVMLGAHVARSLFPEGGAVGSTVRVNGDPYTVKGVFIEMGASAGGDDWDDRIVVPTSTATRRLFNRPFLEQIVLRVDNARNVDRVAESIRDLLRVRHSIATGAPDDFFVRVPEDVEGAALETSNTLTLLLIGIALVALLAGGMVIMNLMLIAVAQRTHEIGVRRASGAKRSDISRLFLLETLFVSLGGGAIGVILAVVVAAAVEAAGIAAIALSPLPFILALACCTLLGILFGLPPARRAAQVDPATSLRAGRI